MRGAADRMPGAFRRKRSYGEKRARVLATFDANPKLNSVQVGHLLGMHDAYVRKTLARNGRRLAR